MKVKDGLETAERKEEVGDDESDEVDDDDTTQTIDFEINKWDKSNWPHK